MSRRTLLGFFALFLTGTPVPQALAETPPHWSETQTEVWQVVLAWNDAFEANDVARYFTFVDPSITVITPGNPFRITGIAADRQEFEFSLRRGSSRVGYFQEIDPQVTVHGSVAIVTYYSRGFYGTESGATGYYKETDVLVKKDGAWKIVHVHLSSASK
jgi:ketosteroid isomerase-like protein